MQMKKTQPTGRIGKVASLALALALLLGRQGLAVEAEGLGWPSGTETTGYRLGGYTVTVPSAWQVEGDGANGILRWEFAEGSTTGYCVMNVVGSTGEAESLQPALEEAALRMGGERLQTETIGSRLVVLCDMLQVGQRIVGAAFMEGNEIGTINIAVRGASSLTRQREIARQLIGALHHDSQDVLPLLRGEPVADSQGQVTYPLGYWQLTVPQEWTLLNPEVESQIQLQLELEEKPGMCVMSVMPLGEEIQPQEALTKAAGSLGAATYDMAEVEGRTVLLCDLDQGGTAISALLFVEERQLVILTAYIAGAETTGAQRSLLGTLVSAIRYVPAEGAD